MVLFMKEKERNEYLVKLRQADRERGEEIDAAVYDAIGRLGETSKRFTVITIPGGEILGEFDHYRLAKIFFTDKVPHIGPLALLDNRRVSETCGPRDRYRVTPPTLLQRLSCAFGGHEFYGHTQYAPMVHCRWCGKSGRWSDAM